MFLSTTAFLQGGLLETLSSFFSLSFPGCIHGASHILVLCHRLFPRVNFCRDEHGRGCRLFSGLLPARPKTRLLWGLRRGTSSCPTTVKGQLSVALASSTPECLSGASGEALCTLGLLWFVSQRVLRGERDLWPLRHSLKLPRYGTENFCCCLLHVTICYQGKTDRGRLGEFRGPRAAVHSLCGGKCSFLSGWLEKNPGLCSCKARALHQSYTRSPKLRF